MNLSARCVLTILRCVSALCITMAAVVVHAQSVDSLERALQEKQLPGASRLQAYDNLSWGYLSKDAGKSVYYATQGISEAVKAKDRLMEATLLRNLGVAYYMKAQYDSATLYLEEALEKAVNGGYTALEGRIYNGLGNLYNHQSEYARALEYYFKSLSISERLRDHPLEGLYNNIAVLYQNMRNEKQARHYFEKARVEAKRTGNRWVLGSVALAMMSYYRTEMPAKALELAKEALEHFKAEEDVYNEILATLAVGEAHRYSGAHDLALAYAEQGLERATNSSFPKLIAEAEADLSSIYFDQGDFSRSILHARRLWERDSADFDLAGSALMQMARGYMYSGKADSAHQVLEKYRDWVMAHSGEEFQKSLSELEVRYETDKKNLQIAAMQKQRDLYVWLSVVVAVLLLTALAFFVVRHRLTESKRRIAEQETQRLLKEKQLVSVQAALDGEAAERTRLARDLHDGLGSMLSVVKMNLPEIKSGSVLEATDVSRFHNALNMLDHSIQELRRVAHHMMPESLLRHGLAASLGDFCNAIPGVTFYYFGTPERLPQKLETLIYRCIHELVNNALKHANATAIGVQLVREEGRVSFTVQDNGTGFDTGVENEGMGLKNVRQRVEAFGGKLDIYSSNEKGTEVHAEFSLSDTSDLHD